MKCNRTLTILSEVLAQGQNVGFLSIQASSAAGDGEPRRYLPFCLKPPPVGKLSLRVEGSLGVWKCNGHSSSPLNLPEVLTHLVALPPAT